MNELMKLFMEGAGNLLPIAAILLMALALGDVAKLLNRTLCCGCRWSECALYFFRATVFLVSGFIAFSVGSSWGTFAIMIPIALSIASNLDLSITDARRCIIGRNFQITLHPSATQRLWHQWPLALIILNM